MAAPTPKKPGLLRLMIGPAADRVPNVDEIEADYVARAKDKLHPEDRAIFEKAHAEKDEATLRSLVKEYGMAYDPRGFWQVKNPWRLPVRRQRAE